VFDTLLASRPSHARPHAQVAGSILLHTLAICAAALVTRGSAESPVRPGPALPLPVYRETARTPGPTPASVAATSAAAAVTPAPSALPVSLVVGELELPAIEGLPTPDAWSTADPGPPTSLTVRSLGAGTARSAPGGGQPLRAGEVDEPARRLATVAPIYPAPLRAAGLEGAVRVAFIVDTVGRVEPASVRTVAASHAGFVESAEAAVRAQQFAPARKGGRPVRTLAEVTVRFTLDAGG